MIPIAEHCGLCAGAKRSIDIAETALRDAAAAGRPVVLYKELLHNAAVMERLKAAGALCAGSVGDIPEGAVVVVRAHGEGKDFYDAMAAISADVRDATCANVKRVHGLVRAAHAAGRAVVIFGKHGHAEVEGANGWCGRAAAILESEADVAAMPGPAADSVLAVCQTTAARDKAERLLAALRLRFPGKEIEFTDTICSAPLRIHRPSEELAARCDILFTIGGRDSANTAELRKKCAAVGAAECPPPIDSCAGFLGYLKANAAKIAPGLRYGFTAGASTPLEEVEKCRDLLAFRLHYIETKARLEGKMAAVNAGFAGGGNRLLREAGGHFAAVNGGGKYVRGVLAGLGCRIASGETSERADALSLAFEVFQTAVLIHDDLIDHAETRRGRATVHRRYRDGYAARGGDPRLAGETADAMAVCVGDWGLFKSVAMLAEAYAGEPRLAELVRLFSTVIIRTIQGEIIDVALPFEQRTGISSEGGESLLGAIREIHRLKTAWYTTTGPLACGMILGGVMPDSDEGAAMREFADHLGAAFQIQDDILGVFGDAGALGKDVGSDVSEYKQTLLYAHTQAESPELFRELRRYYGKRELSAGDAERVREIFRESGAYAKTVAEMRGRLRKARESLDGAGFLSAEDKSVLRGLVIHLGMRDN